MRRGLWTIGLFLVIACLAAGVGIAAAQDKATGQDKKESAAADPLTGDWEGSVETPNGTITFTMKLKLEKDKLTGEIASAEGGTALSGTWSEGKFSASFDYNGTPMTMTGALKDAALAGDMKFGGGDQAMSWTAKKKA